MIMALNQNFEGDENTADAIKVSHGIFSILETNWLFGSYENQKLWISSFLAENSISSAGTADGIPGSRRRRRSKACILSIDGGGMRGIIACRALLHLQNALKLKTGDPNAQISDYFDMAAGTNIGGIITASLFAKDHNGRPLCKAEEALEFIIHKGKDMFKSTSLLPTFLRQKPKYSTNSLERVLKGLFNRNGRPLTLRDTVKPILIPCYDLSSAAPFVFSQADALQTQNYNFNMWEVCAATMCSPGLYRPIAMRSVDGRIECIGIDGGLAMNNPTAAAITHVMNNKRQFPCVQEVEDLLVLSLGTGDIESKYEFEDIKMWKASEWAKPVMDIVMAGVSDTVDHAVSLAFGDHRQNYVRVQATRLPERRVSEMDDPSPSNVNSLMKLADDMLKRKSMEYLPFGWKSSLSESNAERLDWFAEQLVAEHRFRTANKMLSN